MRVWCFADAAVGHLIALVAVCVASACGSSGDSRDAAVEAGDPAVDAASDGPVVDAAPDGPEADTIPDSAADTTPDSADAMSDSAADAAADPEAEAGLPVDVLLVVGGSLDADHAFVRNAQRHIDDVGFTLQTAALAEVLSEASVLASHRFAAIVLSDYQMWAEHPPLRERITRTCQAAGCGVLFLYVDSGAPLFGVSGTDRRQVVSQAIADAGWVDLFNPAVAGVPIPDSVPDYATLLDAGDGAHIAFTATEVDGLMAGASVVGLPASEAHVRTVLFGTDYFDHWFNRLLLHDALHWASGGVLTAEHRRWIAIDVDDVFQPNWSEDEELRTVKMQAADVDALVALGERLDEQIAGDFRFNLGFNSGWYGEQHGAGGFDDAAGDLRFVERRNEFDWFDHLPNHEAVTGLDRDGIADLMAESRAWAEAHAVALLPYAVTPRHLGIETLYEPLYDAWADAGITHSAAPLDFPAFTYRGVTVAPRANCGPPCDSELSSFADLPAAEIELQVRTTLLPRTIRERMLIFVTHQSGFARDRPAAHLFTYYFDFLSEWTTFELHTDRVDRLVDLAYERRFN